MIKTTELRISNIIRLTSDNDELIYVAGIDKTTISITFNLKSNSYVPITEIEAIPVILTEEWLLKFGFEKTVNETIFKCRDYPIYYIRDIGQPKGGNRMFYFENSTTKLTMIQFVHQLQNLFFALTGEELMIQERLLTEHEIAFEIEREKKEINPDNN